MIPEQAYDDAHRQGSCPLDTYSRPGGLNLLAAVPYHKADGQPTVHFRPRVQGIFALGLEPDTPHGRLQHDPFSVRDAGRGGGGGS